MAGSKYARQKYLDMIEEDIDRVTELVAGRLDYAIRESISFIPAGGDKISQKSLRIFVDGVEEAIKKMIANERNVLAK